MGLAWMLLPITTIRCCLWLRPQAPRLSWTVLTVMRTAVALSSSHGTRLSAACMRADHLHASRDRPPVQTAAMQNSRDFHHGAQKPWMLWISCRRMERNVWSHVQWVSKRGCPGSSSSRAGVDGCGRRGGGVARKRNCHLVKLHKGVKLLAAPRCVVPCTAPWPAEMGLPICCCTRLSPRSCWLRVCLYVQ